MGVNKLFPWYIFILWLPFSTYPQSAFKNAWENTLKTQPALQASVYRLKAKEAGLGAARAQMLPKLDATANYQYLTETAHLQITIPTAPPAPPISMNKELGDHDKAELGITASYALFTGFAKTNQILSQNYAVKTATLETVQIKNQLAFQFYAIHLSMQSLLIEDKLRKQKVSAYIAHVNHLTNQEKSGTATKAQVLSAQADLARSAADTAMMERQIDSTRGEFESLTQMDYPTDESWEIEFSDSDSILKSLQAEELESQAKMIEAAGKASTSNYLPYISSYVGYRYGNPGLNQSADEWMGYGVLGVQAQWNLFDGFERKNLAKKTTADSRSLVYEATKIRNAQHVMIRALNAEKHSLQMEELALNAGLNAAKAAHTAYQAAYANGVATSDDVLDVEIKAIELEARLAQWQLRKQMLGLRLQWVSGKSIQFFENRG